MDFPKQEKVRFSYMKINGFLISSFSPNGDHNNCVTMAFSNITATLNPHLITQIDIHGLLSRLESELSIKAVYRKGKYSIDCSDTGKLKECEALVNRFIAEAAEDDDTESKWIK